MQFFIITRQGEGIVLFFFFFEGIKLMGVWASGGMRQDGGREQGNSNTELGVTSNMGLLEERAREQCQRSLLF